MKKYAKTFFALLLFLRSVVLCHASLGISYDNNSGEATVTWTNGSPLSGLYGYGSLQEASSLSGSNIWTGTGYGGGTGSVVFPAIGQQQFFRVSLTMPVFQFAMFYNMDLEIAAAQTLDIIGPVYSNDGLWSGSTTITFASTVSAVGLATNTVYDPFCPGYSGSGKSTYSITGQPTSGNPPLMLLLPSSGLVPSAESLINLPPANYAMGTAAAFTTDGQTYLANAADLFLTNAASGTNFNSLRSVGNNMALYYQDSANAPNYLAWATNDFYMFSNRIGSVFTIYATNVVPGFFLTNNLSGFKWTNNPTGTNQLFFAGYSFLTNVLFYDAREGWHGGSGPAKSVQAVQIDVQKFNRWLTNSPPNSGSNYNHLSMSHKGHPIDSIYVFNGVSLTSTTLPAVRVTDGGSLPSADGNYGFTLATAMPLYIWGDYNVSNYFGSSIDQNNATYTSPAGFMADAITVLSDGWSDGNTGNQFSGGPTAESTTINAACLAGIVESNTNNPASDGNGYSGGVENFLRTLENWSPANGKQTLYYNGSMVAMFPSQYATNCWEQTGGYYTAPNRSWAFDTNFENASGLPPLTPMVTGYIIK
ncbi:MAG TPA: hypothetical protein VNU95_07025 [Candidatus Acidoferrales bacterium]|jgi:hypothetical protein|nr:hypothetical protein [Candidatus Acidoferrales bacterium]